MRVMGKAVVVEMCVSQDDRRDSGRTRVVLALPSDTRVQETLQQSRMNHSCRHSSMGV